MSIDYDVIVIGAGAAGLMAAAQAGNRGRKVLLIEHTQKIGEKIRISGGGRCNFTNLYVEPKAYLSQNPHFVKSALARYDQHAFIKLIASYGIAFHEKTLGQLFCDGSSQQIIQMLLSECSKGSVNILLGCTVHQVQKSDHFLLHTNQGDLRSTSLIVATGGLSIPKTGATDFGYRLAEQFSLPIIPTYPALVPLTLSAETLHALSGIAIAAHVSYQKTLFAENILFTHRGLSGPAILQISSYLQPTARTVIHINMLPELALTSLLLKEKQSKTTLGHVLKIHLPSRLVENLLSPEQLQKKLADYKNADLEQIAARLHAYPMHITGTEGYAKAEVTAGGVDTQALSSQTLMARSVPNLFFVGEVVDVTGWLGGYNFQWAWASGYAAGMVA